MLVYARPEPPERRCSNCLPAVSEAYKSEAGSYKASEQVCGVYAGPEPAEPRCGAALRAAVGCEQAAEMPQRPTVTQTCLLWLP